MKSFATSHMSTRSVNTAACFTSGHTPKRLPVKAQVVREEVSRRESFAGFAAAFTAASLVTRPAQALLGIGEDKEKEEEYKKLTTEVIKDVQGALALPKDDPARPEAIQKVRDETTTWVAKYRRESQFQGRASYGNTYSALSALAGHYNSFGPETNVPKKRLDRLTKELADAEKLIARGR